MKTVIRRPSTLALAASLGCALATGTLAQGGNHDQALRELNIMRNIFRASMESDDNRRFNLGSAEALYLANQGMVFTFDMPGRGWLNLPGLEKLQALGGGAFDFDFDLDFDDGEGFVNGGPDSSPQLAEYQQKMRDFNEAMRDRQSEMRDLQREMRELQRAELRDEQSGNDAEMERLTTEMNTLGEEIEELGNSINATQQTYDAERKAQLAQIHQAYAARIFGTLCDYGNTLRSLGSGQHVNIVLRNHEDNEATVYIVDYNALSSCSSGESLQQGTVNYLQPLR